MVDATSPKWPTEGKGTLLMLIDRDKLPVVNDRLRAKTVMARNEHDFAQLSTARNGQVRTYGFEVGVRSAKLFVTNTTYKDATSLAQEVQAEIFRWVPVDVKKFSKLKRHKCGQSCKASARCVTPGCLCSTETGECI